MALNIPNVGAPFDTLSKGIDTGSTFFARLMQPVLERERQKQLEQHFQQQMALRKQAMAKSGANSDLQRAILQEKLKSLQNPNAELQQLLGLLGNKPGTEAKSESYLPSIGGNFQGHEEEQYPDLEKAFTQGQFGQQQPIPELNEQATSPFEAQGQQQNSGLGGMNMDALKDAFIKGRLKKKYGIDLTNGQNSALHGAARDASDLERLRQQVGEDNPVYQNAKEAYDAQIDAKKDLRDLRARTKAGLKPGEKEFFDEKTGQPLGKEIPLTAKERESEEGNVLFNELYPYVYKGASPFSGEGSITRLQQAAANYKTNPQARKLFDDFLLADKALAAATVNEASTLKAGRTNRTYTMLKESLDAQDIPNLVKKIIKEYKIPASAQLKAGMRYQELLSDARKKARTGTPATQKLFYNPEQQAAYEAKKNEGEVGNEATNQKHGYRDDDLVKVEGPNGVEVMTYAKARQLGAK